MFNCLRMAFVALCGTPRNPEFVHSETTTVHENGFQQPASCRLLELPFEIFVHIIENLDDEDAICTFMTCRAATAIKPIINNRAPEKQAKRVVFARLERDISGHSYCPIRNSLMPFTQQHLASDILRFHDCTAGVPQGVPPSREHVLTFAFSKCFKLSFCTARLVINGHLYGLQHGLPTSAIAHAHGVVLREPFIHLYESWAAKVDTCGQLILSCSRTWSSSSTILQLRFTTRKITMCYHAEVDANKDEHGCRRNVIGNGEHRTKGRCDHCDTRWELQISPAVGYRRAEGPPLVGEEKWTVTATTLHNAGACREPGDQKWRALVTAVGSRRSQIHPARVSYVHGERVMEY
ncbi:hypothetical protein MN608_07488 [Microdochium nivale]|nr:hypothetical protein MN608_07488 [Microdochium nivale]